MLEWILNKLLPTYRCLDCYKTFHNQEGLRKHLNPLKFICPTCGHPQRIPPEYEKDNLFKCKHCGAKAHTVEAWNTRQSLQADPVKDKADE